MTVLPNNRMAQTKLKKKKKVIESKAINHFEP